MTDPQFQYKNFVNTLDGALVLAAAIAVFVRLGLFPILFKASYADFVMGFILYLVFRLAVWRWMAQPLIRWYRQNFFYGPYEHLDQAIKSAQQHGRAYSDVLVVSGTEFYVRKQDA